MRKNFYKPNKRIKRSKKITESPKTTEFLSLKKDNHSVNTEDIKLEAPLTGSPKPEEIKKTITLREYEQSYLKISRSQRKKKLTGRLPLHLVIIFLIVFTILHRS